jgi:hypothetical protein
MNNSAMVDRWLIKSIFVFSKMSLLLPGPVGGTKPGGFGIYKFLLSSGLMGLKYFSS